MLHLASHSVTDLVWNAAVVRILSLLFARLVEVAGGKCHTAY